MIPNIGEMPVTDDEWLARYIVHKDHVRADGTVKQDPFIPYSKVELSVTRHRGLNEVGLWAAGELVAQELSKSLRGRADTQARVHVRSRLRVVPKPLPKNANHADVVDWPADKPAQKEIALLIAKEASFKPKPQQ
jgi:hypothetical protein